MNGRLTNRRSRRGAVLLAALALLTVVLISTGMLLRQVTAQQRATRDQASRLQAMYLAESALDRAAMKFAGDRAYRGETWRPELTADAATANVFIQVQAGGEENEFSLDVRATYQDHPARTAQAVARRVIHVRSAAE